MPTPVKLSHRLKAVAVRTVKPLVSDTVWQTFRTRGRRSAAPALAPKPKPKPKPIPARSLTELGHKYRTDKVSNHRYTEHYEHHLRHLVPEQFTMLEIGIGGYSRAGQGGASLRMWKEFFPKAQILGLDIRDKSFVDEPRIRSYQGSQIDAAILHTIVRDAGELQVIIDDGSHRPQHIRETFAILFPLLADGGIYAIEDTQTSYWPEFGGSEDRQDRGTTMALVKDLLDGLNHEEFIEEPYQPSYTDLNVLAIHAYHNLVFFEKGNNHEGTRRRKILKKRYQGEPK